MSSSASAVGAIEGVTLAILCREIGSEGGDESWELNRAGGELIRDMFSDEGDISTSLGKGDLYGLEGLAAEDPRGLLPYVSGFLGLNMDLGGSGAAKIPMTAVSLGRKGK